MLKSALRKMTSADKTPLDALNYVTLDMGVSRLLDLSNEAESLSIGYDKKTVVAENFYYLAKTKTKSKAQKNDDEGPLVEFLSHPDPHIDLYLLVYSDSLDERSSFYKALLSGGARINPVSEFTPAQWLEFAPNFFAKRGGTISPEAVRELLARTGGDYEKFLNEAQKLLAYSAGEGVSVQNVKELVSAPLEDDVFALSNALVRGKKKEAIEIYHSLKVHNVEAVSLFHILAGQFRFLSEVSYLKSKGAFSSQISSTLFCSMGRANAALSNLRLMKDETPLNALEEIYSYELKVLTGKLDDSSAMDLFLANFSL